MNVTERQAIEKTIASLAVQGLLAAGYSLTVDDGDVYPVKKSTDHDTILAAMFSVDEEHLIAFEGDKRVGAVFFVYGNDGHDVINDYTTKLKPALRLADEAAEAFSA